MDMVTQAILSHYQPEEVVQAAMEILRNEEYDIYPSSANYIGVVAPTPHICIDKF